MSESEPGRKLVVIGAGMTGRGQVAQLAFESGWRLVFIDRDAPLVELLKRAGAYVVHLVGEKRRDVVINRFQTVHTTDTEGVCRAFTDADLVVTSVIAGNLPDVAQTAAVGLRARFERSARPLDVICAENMPHSSTRLGQLLREAAPDVGERVGTSIGFPDSMIARVVPRAADLLSLYAENYNEWTADAKAFRAGLPDIRGLECVDNQDARLERKLYIHNTGHAATAFWGLLAGHRYIHEAARDPSVAEAIRGAIRESAEAIRLEHGFPRDEIDAYRDALLPRLQDDALPDDLYRVARNPIRKLGSSERIFGPIALCLKHGVIPRHLARTAAAALLVRIPGDVEGDRLGEMVRREGPLGALRDILGDEVPGEISSIIETEYRRLAEENPE